MHPHSDSRASTATHFTLTLALAASAAAWGAGAAAAPMACAELEQLKLPQASVRSAVEVPAGALPAGTPVPTFPPNTPASALPAYCKVKAVVAPSIGFELWMPLKGWNGRFEGLGNHGFAGTLDRGDMAWQLARGYAVASTDTGHAGNEPLPWMQNPQQLTDYGYRAVHEMTVNAKTLVDAFYGRTPHHAYWNGCSTGGKQALTEAQRYPADYDGISVGDANFDQIGNRAQYVWNGQATFANPATKLSSAQLSLVNKAVLKACDALDGVADDSIEDPRQCGFDPAVLQCQPGQDAAACLSAEQVGAVKKLYAGPRNPHTGEEIYPGLTPGSELGWGGVVNGPNIYATADQFFKYMVFKRPDWDWRTYDFDADWVTSRTGFDRILNATDPDLRAFEQRGGKLFQYHGWKDTVHPAMRSIEYYESVLSALDAHGDRKQAIARTQKFYRLFMVPGSNGCASAGAWPDVFDPMDTLTRWVEKGTAPDRVLVSHRTNGAVDRTRPLCAYPKVAVYDGSGSSDEAKNFRCQAPVGEATAARTN